MTKKFVRSGVVNRPLPSARLVAIERGGAIELIGEEVIATRKSLRKRGNFVGEGDGLLIDLQFLEDMKAMRRFQE